MARDSVRIALTYAALNGLDVTAADVKNAYLTAPTSERHYIICTKEFGENAGKRAIITRALYGGLKAGRDFWLYVRECMLALNYKSCLADPDVWMKPETLPNGTTVWSYVLLYTDDVLIISNRGEEIIRNEIGKYFRFKEDSIGPPDIYLGGKMRL